MYASGSRTKNNTNNSRLIPTTSQQLNRAKQISRVPPPRTPMRGNSNLSNASQQSVNNLNAAHHTGPVARSKFTDRKSIPLPPPINNANQSAVQRMQPQIQRLRKTVRMDKKPLLSNSTSNVTRTTISVANRRALTERHSTKPVGSANPLPPMPIFNNNSSNPHTISTAGQQQSRTRPWARYSGNHGHNRHGHGGHGDHSKSMEKEKEIPRSSDMGIQTNEYEILNRDLLIGDIKFMLPSNVVIAEIERKREEIKKRQLLKAQRKFEEHSEKQEEHLNDLKEFLEKATITKRNRKPPREVVEVDRRLISSMDELLNKKVPKTESITDIKERIKRKEKELMTLFDTVDNYSNFGKDKQTTSSKTNIKK